MSNVHTPLEEKRESLVEEQTATPRKDAGIGEKLWLRRKTIVAFAFLAVVVLGAALYGPRWVRAFRESPAPAKQSSATGERKVLYWYDAMNPEHHYDKPGKAPDGMDLEPQYAEETPQPTGSAEAATGQRKVLFWFDPMHPAYKSDNPGIAPDCGMQLVPKYADEESNLAKMPAGTVMIALDKQQLIGVRTGKVAKQSLERLEKEKPRNP